jgi:two-component system response regulator RpaA
MPLILDYRAGNAKAGKHFCTAPRRRCSGRTASAERGMIRGNDMATARILVVDDDHLIRQMVHDLLQIADFEVSEAVDGADGLAQAATVRPDLILLDLMLPDMDGYTVCRNLKANQTTSTIPVVFVTASADLGLNRQAYAAGAAACITKPFQVDALLTVINTTLQGVPRVGTTD